MPEKRGPCSPSTPSPVAVINAGAAASGSSCVSTVLLFRAALIVSGRNRFEYCGDQVREQVGVNGSGTQDFFHRDAGADGDDELDEAGQLRTVWHGGGLLEDVECLVGGRAAARDQAVAELRITHGAQPVLEEHDVVVGVVVDKVEQCAAQRPSGRGGVAATALERGRELFAAKLELPVEQG